MHNLFAFQSCLIKYIGVRFELLESLFEEGEQPAHSGQQPLLALVFSFFPAAAPKVQEYGAGVSAHLSLAQNINRKEKKTDFELKVC